MYLRSHFGSRSRLKQDLCTGSSLFIQYNHNIVLCLPIMAEEELDFAGIESVVALRSLLEQHTSDPEASDDNTLKEKIDGAWDQLNAFSNKPTYICISQDATHKYFKKGWMDGCRAARILTKVSVVSSILQQADAMALKGFFNIPAGAFLRDMWFLKNGCTDEWKRNRPRAINGFELATISPMVASCVYKKYVCMYLYVCM